ncbi:hypothetical protein [Streptomyces sp. NPDC001165]
MIFRGTRDGPSTGDGDAEGRVLTHLQGRLPVPTPRVHGFGAHENGWRSS